MRLLPRSPSTPPRAPPRRRAWLVGLAFAAALAAFCITFDSNWLQPLIRHHVMARSGRSLQCDDLALHWPHGLDPTIECHGLVIQNAPWAASKAPLIRAGRVAATVSWRSLASDMTVIDRLELDDAQVDMERQADGLRNWRVTRPDDRGPPHVRVLELDARRSTLHLVDGRVALELDVASTPLPAPRALPAHADLPLTRHLAYRGKVGAHAFEGTADVSDVLTFGATPRLFALHASARLGALAVEAAGVSNDAHALGDIDVDATLAVTGAGATWPLPQAAARLRPLHAEGRLQHAGERWVGSGVHVRAGRATRLIADATLTGGSARGTTRRTATATLRDAVIDLDDIAPPSGQARLGARTDLVHGWSNTPLPFEGLRRFDAEIDLHPARIVGAGRDVVQGVRGHAALKDGVLALSALDVGLADGHVTGALRLDAGHVPAQLSLDLVARGLRIDRLSSTLAASGALAGAVDGRARLNARGESLRDLAASSDGTLTVSLGNGATVSKRLDAKLGLNGGEWLRTLWDASARVPVQCAGATLALARGVATPRRFVFETPRTALALRGSLDLAGQTVAVELTPMHKKLALLTLDKSIRIDGAWHAPRVTLVPAVAEPPQRCASAASP